MRSLQSQLQTCARAQWLLLAGGIVLLGGFYLFGYRPSAQQLRDLHVQIESKQRMLEVSRLDAANLPEVTREVEALQARLERFDKKLPRQQDLPQIIQDIERFSQRAALRNPLVQLEAARHQELFSEAPIRLRFQGDFVSVHAFLRQLEDMQRLTRVQSLQMRSRDSTTGLVDVELTTTVYFLEGH